MTKESVKVLQECIDLQVRKSHDYQNPNSTVRQADYYPNGILTINDIIWAKMLRIRSLLESGSQAKNESLEDSYKDLVNYASFAVSYMRGKMEGQDPNRDMLNRPSRNSAGAPSDFLTGAVDNLLDKFKNPPQSNSDIVDKFKSKLEVQLPCDVEPAPSETIVHDIKTVASFGNPKKFPTDDFILSNPPGNGEVTEQATPDDIPIAITPKEGKWLKAPRYKDEA